MRVAIIGGGIIGLSVAWRLAMSGRCDAVAIYDAQAESREASWAAAGMLAPHNEATEENPLWDLCCQSFQRWPQFLRELGCEAEDVDYRNNGSLLPILTDDDCRNLEDIDYKANWLSAAGIAIDRWHGARIRRDEPSLGTHIQEVIRMPGGHVNPRLVCQFLRQRCADLGVQLFYDCSVEAIEDARLRFADAQSQQYDHIVMAAGAWTPQMAQLCGISLRGEPVKGQMIAFDTSGTNIALNHFIHCAHAYCVPRVGTGMVIGASMEYQGFDRAENEAAIASLRAGAIRLIPELAQAPVSETWTGLRPRLHGGLPMFARINQHLSMCSGHFRNGILLAPISADIMSQLVTGECSAASAVNLEPFNGSQVRAL